VTSYQVYMDGVKVQSGITALEITQTDGIITGYLHSFTVTAVNGRGEGAHSDPISIYAATISTVPKNVRRLTADGSYVSL
jgi:hypothetical protein